MTEEIYLPISEWAETSAWPLAGFLPDSLDELYLGPSSTDPATGDASVEVMVLNELVLQIPGLDFLTLAIAPAGGSTAVNLAISRSPFCLRVQAPVTLRVDANLLRPLKPGPTPGTYEPDFAAKTLDIVLGTIDIGINGDGDFNFDLPGATPAIPRCMIGQTGVVLEIGKLQWLTPSTPTTDLPPAPTVVPQGFTGLFLDDVTVEIPQLPAAMNKLRMDDVFLGTGGFTGKVLIEDTAGTLTWDTGQSPAKYAGGVAVGELYGFQCGLKKIEIEIVQSCLQKSSILGEMFVPYLDKRIGVDLKLSMSGDLLVGLASPQAKNPEKGAELRSDGLLYLLISAQTSKPRSPAA
jgi:hypothetical protein